MKKLLLGLSISSLVLAACSKSNETTVANNNPGGTPAPGNCDTVNMKYATDIQPIIQANCYSCHGNGQSSGGVALDTYDGIKKQVDNGNLIGVITHAAGYPPMPKGGSKLSDCDINKIKDWIDRQAQDN